MSSAVTVVDLVPRIVSVGEPVTGGAIPWDAKGTVYSVAGPQIYVDWRFTTPDGVERFECCWYHVSHMEWDGKQWVIPRGMLGH